MATLQSHSGAALEYKKELEAMPGIDRDSIWHLTSMARDNVEEAAAISKVIEASIRSTRPQRKLVPFYVLDSVVKNVGSPYNVYFGFGLFKTYLDAYAHVDGGTRRSMEAMLKTWKQPVPNTMDTDPVFPADITSSIEKALQTVQQATQLKVQPPYGQYPQQFRQQIPLPPRPPQANGYMSEQQSHYSHHSQTPSFSSTAEHPIGAIQQQGLLRDVDTLLNLLQNQLDYNSWNHDLRAKVNNIVQLRHAIHTQHLVPCQWRSIQALVSSELHGRLGHSLPTLENSLSVGLFPRPTSTTPQFSSHQNPPTAPLSPPVQQEPQHQYQAYTTNDSSAPSTLPTNGLDPSTLAALAATLNAQSGSAIQNTIDPNHSSRTGNGDIISHSANSTSPSIDLEAITGLYQRIFTPNQTANSANTVSSMYLPPDVQANPQPIIKQPLQELKLDSRLLKAPRAELYHSLWQARSLCRTCGRRFEHSEVGKARKTRHLDYHFRTNMRRQDAGRGAAAATRRWFMDEPEWIKYRETDDAEEVNYTIPNVSGAPAGHGSGSVDEAVDGRQYARIPEDRGSTNAVCPICQEGFKDTWRAAIQEWVWPDCVQAKDGRYFHDSCMRSYKEDEVAARDREAKSREVSTKDVAVDVDKASATNRIPLRDGSVGKKRKAEEVDA